MDCMGIMRDLRRVFDGLDDSEAIWEFDMYYLDLENSPIWQGQLVDWLMAQYPNIWDKWAKQDFLQ